MREITKEELQNSFEHHLTVGALKQFLEKHNPPDTAKVVVQRVEDFYFDKNNWGTYLKKGFNYYSLERLKESNIPKLGKITEKDLKDSMEQYIPAWCCVHYKDEEDVLFIDLHY